MEHDEGKLASIQHAFKKFQLMHTLFTLSLQQGRGLAEKREITFTKHWLYANGCLKHTIHDLNYLSNHSEIDSNSPIFIDKKYR